MSPHEAVFAIMAFWFAGVFITALALFILMTR